MGRRTNRRAGDFCASANNFLPVALPTDKDGFRSWLEPHTTAGFGALSSAAV